MASWICSLPPESSSGQSGGCTFSSEWFHLLPSLSPLTFSFLSSPASPHSPFLSTYSNTTLSTFWPLAVQLLIKGESKVQRYWRRKQNDHISEWGRSSPQWGEGWRAKDRRTNRRLCKGREDGQFFSSVPDTLPLGMVRHRGQPHLLWPWREWSQSGVEDGANWLSPYCNDSGSECWDSC